MSHESWRVSVTPRLKLEFDATTQLLRVLGDAAAFPVLIQRCGFSWIDQQEAVLPLGLGLGPTGLLNFLHEQTLTLILSYLLILSLS